MEQADYYSSLSQEAKRWVSDHEKFVRSSIFWWVICIASAILIPAVVVFIFKQAATQAQWVQRAGTIVLVCSILAEMKAQNVRRNIFVVSSNRLCCELYIEEKYKWFMPFVQYFTYLLIAFGTLMTGYGDMVYQSFLSQS